MLKQIAKILGVRTDYEQLFFFNEYRTLSGVRNRTIINLISILFFTLLALGFAVGGIQNLKDKMDNPFTNWVNLSLSNQRIVSKAGMVEEYYSDQAVKDTLNLDDVRGWSLFNLEMYHQDFSVAQNSSDSLLYSLLFH